MDGIKCGGEGIPGWSQTQLMGSGRQTILPAVSSTPGALGDVSRGRSASPRWDPASDQTVHKGVLWALGEEGDAPGPAPGPPPAPEDPLRPRVFHVRLP